MQYFENDDRFKANFTIPFSERFKNFKKELEFCADTRYKQYFDARNESINRKVLSHRIWHYLFADTGLNGGKPIAILFLRQNADLDIEIINLFDRIFQKHFGENESNPMMRKYFAPAA